MESPRSSYKSEKLTYEHIFQLICFMVNPKKIIEFGILDGFSLECFAKYANTLNCEINAFDIFDDFEGNHGDETQLKKKFISYPNVKIQKGDYYKEFNKIEDNSIDILHIDIANTGDVYKFAVEKYLNKITHQGIMILEGGSLSRDNVWWMEKYNKPKIAEYLQNLDPKLYTIILPHPSLTLIKKNKED